MISSVASRTVSAGRAACRTALADLPRAAARRLPRPDPLEDPDTRGDGAGPRAARRAAGLEDILCDDAPLPSSSRATAAARAFAAGNGYLAGLIVDRFA